MKHKHHIIPRHIGGSDDPSNLIELTPEAHAEAHRALYEKDGRWQDYLAWQGLAKLSMKKDHVKLCLSEAGKKGNAKRQTTGGNAGMKYNMENIKALGIRKGEKNPSAKEFTIVFPDGTTVLIKSLKTWCELNGLIYNTFYNQCVGRRKTYKGYSIKE
jgi:hypothetical protein